MEDLQVFSKVFERIDHSIETIILNNVSNFMNIFSPIFMSGFTVYVIFITWSYFGSSIEQSLWDLLKRIIAWGVIISFSINVGSYISNIVPIVMHLGDGAAQAFSGNSTSANALDSLVKLLQDMTEKNSEAADGIWGIDGISARLSTFFTNTIIIIIFSLFLIIAAAYILLAKVFLAILAVLGPVFIALALFPATKNFFSAWLNQVVNYSLYMLLVNIVGSILIQYLSDTFDSTSLLSESGMIHLVLVILLFAIILLKLPELSSGLAGGISANGFGALAQTAQSAAGMMKGKPSSSSHSGKDKKQKNSSAENEGKP